MKTKLLRFSKSTDASTQWSEITPGVSIRDVRAAKFDLESAVCRLGNIVVMELTTQSGFYADFDVPSEGYSFCFQKEGYNNTVFMKNRHHLREGEGIILNRSLITSVESSENSRKLCARFDHAAILRELALRLDRNIENAIVFDRDPGILASKYLSHLIEAIKIGSSEQSIFEKSPLASESLQQHFVSFLIGCVNHSYSEHLQIMEPAAASRQVRLAIDFMNANSHRPISVGDVAAAAGTSLRSLQGALRKAKGITISEYLRKIRLRAVYTDLNQQGSRVSIKEIAYRWGFVHLGRFANYYRGEFGELPVETQRRHNRVVDVTDTKTL